MAKQRGHTWIVPGLTLHHCPRASTRATARFEDITQRRVLPVVCEEAVGVEALAPGFPAEMTDDEPEEPGYEVIPASRS